MADVQIVTLHQQNNFIICVLYQLQSIVVEQQGNLSSGECNYAIYVNLILFYQSKKTDELSLQLQSLENEKSSFHAVVSTQERQISDLNVKVHCLLCSSRKYPYLIHPWKGYVFQDTSPIWTS